MAKYIINAEGKKLGRVASEAAVFLMGKGASSFKRNVTDTSGVQIINVSKLVLPEKKQKSKEYTRYTGYPGGLRKDTMRKVIMQKGYEEVMRRAVYGMLPSNKLRARRMKQLDIQSQ